MYDGIIDNLVCCAPDKWKLSNCLSFGIAYLNPRPSMHSIDLAYERYYTHGENKPTILPQKFYVDGLIKAVIKNCCLHYS